MALLDVKDLCSYFDDEQVIFNLDFKVENHEICTILGANGAGKTTTLNSIASVEVNKTGNIIFDGTDITKFKTHRVIRQGISFVPEMRGTFNQLTVAENLTLGSYLRKDKDALKEDLETVYSYFPFLKDRLKQEAGKLSGGEQQMLAISRCLLMKPKLLMFDEPSLGLAPIVVKYIFETMEKICKEQGIGILVVEQNVHMALSVAQKVFLLDSGKIVMSGKPDDFKKDRSIQRTYLGIT